MKTLDVRMAVKKIPYGNDDSIVLVSDEALDFEEDKQRNVFRVTNDGTIRWQVGDYLATPKLSTFTNIEVQDNKILAYNFDGGLYQLEPFDGKVIVLELLK